MTQEQSSKAKTVTEKKPSQPEAQPPAVIADFVFDQGLFFIVVKNISDQPAYKVSVEFDHKIYGLGGTKEVSALPLFRNIEFLAPQKEIKTFLDGSDSYFARKQPTKVKAVISYRDAAGNEHRVTINHDLEIYRELAFAGPARSVVVTDEGPDEGE